MTELAIPESTTVATVEEQVARYAPAQRSSIADWAHEADLAYQLANRLANTSFIPSTMRGKVGDITACLLAGNELGLPPIAALKSMVVIHGTPGLRAVAQRGLVQSHGHEIEVIESTDTVCRIRGRRKGTETWQESVWTIGRATLAGFVAKNQNYKTQPTNMLAARATGEVSRWIASDVLLGVPYNAEELRDSAPRVTAVQVGAPATGAEVLARRGRPIPPELEAAEVAPEQAETVGFEEDAGASEDEPVNGEPVDEATLLWEEILAAGAVKGWSDADTEREFLKGSKDVPVVMAPVAVLEGFLAHLKGGVA